MPEYEFYRSSVTVDGHDLTIRRKTAPGLPKEPLLPLSTIRGAYFVPARVMTNGRLKIVTDEDDSVSVQSHTKSANDPQVVMFLKKQTSVAEGLYSWLVEIGHHNGGNLPVIGTQDEADQWSKAQKSIVAERKAERKVARKAEEASKAEDRRQVAAARKAEEAIKPVIYSSAEIVRGRPYVEWVEPLKQMNREGRYEESKALLREIVEAAEQQSREEGSQLPPAYYEMLAIIFRREKNYDAEVAVLERYTALETRGGRLDTRLRAARKKQAAAAGTQSPFACPSCGVALDTVPARSRKCADCGNQIVVRHQDGQAILLTVEGDKARENEQVLEDVREHFLRLSNSIGVDDAGFQAEEEQLSARFGHLASPGDVFWGLANRQVMTEAGAGRWDAVRDVYLAMGRVDVEEGRPWLQRAQLAAEMSLKSVCELRRDPVQIGGCQCSECAAASRGVVLSCEQVRASSPLPHAGCLNPPCSCFYYQPRVEEEADGSPTSPPADWYQDPQVPNQLRYWDGRQWTSRTHVPSR